MGSFFNGLQCRQPWGCVREALAILRRPERAGEQIGERHHRARREIRPRYVRYSWRKEMQIWSVWAHVAAVLEEGTLRQICVSSTTVWGARQTTRQAALQVFG